MSVFVSIYWILGCLISVFFSIPYVPTEGYIMFGQSCALSGVANSIGIELHRGFDACFSQFNQRGGFNGGVTLNLTIKDDQYEPEYTISNTIQFLNDSSVFALIGYVGSVTVLSVADMIRDSEIPLIGASAGTRFLRENFNEYTIFTVPTLDDESSAMIHYLVRKKFILRMSFLYEYFDLSTKKDNSDCFPLLDSISGVLDSYQLEFQYKSSFIRNGLEAINEEFVRKFYDKGRPQAILFCGQGHILAKFIFLYEQLFSEDSVIYVSTSSSGIGSLTHNLEAYGVKANSSEIIVFTGTPNYLSNDDIEMTISHEYLSAMNYIGYQRSFISYKGYLSGRILIEMIKGIYGDLTRENLMKSIYDFHGQFYLPEDFSMGKYTRDQNDPKDNCNQGAKSVYPVRILGTDLFEDVPDGKFSWSGCISHPEEIGSVISFIQSADLDLMNEWKSDSYLNGIRVALFKYNLQKTNSDRILVVISKDDHSNSSIASNYLHQYSSSSGGNSSSIIGFAGWFGSETLYNLNLSSLTDTNLTFLGPSSGSEVFRTDDIPNTINIRAGTREEISSLLQHSLDLKRVRISVLYDKSSPYSSECFKTVEVLLSSIDMNLHSVGFYEGNYSAIPMDELVWDMLYSGVEIPEVIMMFGDFETLSSFIDMVSRLEIEPIVFQTLSSVNSVQFLKQLKEVDSVGDHILSNIFISQVVPNFNDSSVTIVDEYQKDMEEFGIERDSLGFVSLEGYLVGRLITYIISKFSETELKNIRDEDLLDKIYETGSIPLGSIDDPRTLVLGPYDRAKNSFCNSGLRNIWIASLENGEFSGGSSPILNWEESCRFTQLPVYPTFFAQSADLGVDLEVDYSSGIDIGFSESFGRTGPSNLFLISMDDQSNRTKMEKNIYDMSLKNPTSCVGFSTFDTHVSSALKDYSLMMIAPIRVGFGGDVNDENVLHFRPFLMDEVYYLNEYYRAEVQLQHNSNSRKKIGAILQESEGSDNFQMSYHLELMEIVPVTGTASEMADTLIEEDFVVVIYLLEDLDFFKNELFPELKSRMTSVDINDIPDFSFPSHIYMSELKSSEFVSSEFKDYSFVSLYSRSSISFENFIDDYKDQFESFDYAFLGYIVGKTRSTQSYGASQT